MIFLNKDSINTVVATLFEKTTITASTPYYLFEFINDDSDNAKVFTVQDESTNVRRYNQFEITVSGGTENLTAGTIDLTTSGYYKYNIYQMTGQTNLAIESTVSKVESGKMYLSGETVPTIYEYTGGTDSPKYVYEG